MYACIDLGSNSFHILIGEWVDGRIDIVERCSELVQLGEDVRSSGSISATAFQRGVECLQHFKTLMDQYPIEQYWALGTNTFRVTDNAQDFTETAKQIGIEVSTISGVQEAVLIYAGVITSLPFSENHRLVIDIGGGSTEVIIGVIESRLLTESMAIGSVVWRDRFFSGNIQQISMLETQLDLATEASRNVFSEIGASVKKATWSEAYASSGTVKMLAAICAHHGYGDGDIELSALLALKSRLLTQIFHGDELPGLKQRRRDLLLPGWAVLVGLMQAYSVGKINFSATALREGMLGFMVKNNKTLALLENSELPKVSLMNN